MNKFKNVVLITIDALRADHLGCMGYKRNTTPNIDILAKRGVLFKNAIANGPGTPISFQSILTSTYPLMYGGYERLSRQRPIISEVLHNHGYYTMGFTLKPDLSRFYGYNRGFEFFCDYTPVSSGNRIVRVPRFFAGKIRNFFSSKAPFIDSSIEGYKAISWILPHVYASTINNKVLSHLKKVKPNKFFLWIHYMDVHSPYLPTQKFLEDFDPDISRFGRIKSIRASQKPKSITNKELDTLINLYDAGIKSVDSAIQSLLSEMDDIGVLEETLVVLTADHGDEFLDHGGFFHYPKLYDELIHIPLIIYVSKYNIGNIIFDPVEHLDIVPTIVDMLGIEKQSRFLGKSFLPLIDSSMRWEKGVISEVSDDGGLEINLNLRKTSYRTRTWKYIYNKNKEDELFNLLRDPKEVNNILDEEKEIATDLLSKIQKHIIFEEKHKVHLEEERMVKDDNKKTGNNLSTY